MLAPFHKELRLNAGFQSTQLAIILRFTISIVRLIVLTLYETGPRILLRKLRVIHRVHKLRCNHKLCLQEYPYSRE